MPYAFAAVRSDTAAFAESGASAERLWQENGENIYRPNGNVGIGTSSPQSVLDVFRATSDHNLNAVNYTSINPSLRLNASAVGNHQSELRFTKSGTARWSLLNDVFGNDGQTFGVKDWLSNTTPLIVDGSGNVGIGTASPYTRLMVEGPPHTATLIAASGGSAQLALLTREPGTGRQYNIVSTASGEFQIQDTSAGGTLPLRIQGGAPTDLLCLTSSGRMGIGTINPTAKLDVAGDICVTGAKNAIVPTSQGMTKFYCDESTETWFSDRGEARSQW